MVEPIASVGRGAVIHPDDGWAVRTADGSMSAHAEHTIVITNAQPLNLTR